MIAALFARLAARLEALGPECPAEEREAALAEELLRPEWVGALLRAEERAPLVRSCDLARDVALRRNDPQLETAALRAKWRCGAASLFERQRLTVLLASTRPVPVSLSYLLLYGEYLATVPDAPSLVADALGFLLRSDEDPLLGLQARTLANVAALRSYANRSDNEG